MTVDSPSSLKFGHRGDRGDTAGSVDRRGMFLNGQLDEIELFVGRGLTAGPSRVSSRGNLRAPCSETLRLDVQAPSLGKA